MLPSASSQPPLLFYYFCLCAVPFLLLHAFILPSLISCLGTNFSISTTDGHTGLVETLTLIRSERNAINSDAFQMQPTSAVHIPQARVWCDEEIIMPNIIAQPTRGDRRVKRRKRNHNYNYTRVQYWVELIWRPWIAIHIHRVLPPWDCTFYWWCCSFKYFLLRCWWPAPSVNSDSVKVLRALCFHSINWTHRKRRQDNIQDLVTANLWNIRCLRSWNINNHNDLRVAIDRTVWISLRESLHIY